VSCRGECICFLTLMPIHLLSFVLELRSYMYRGTSLIRKRTPLGTYGRPRVGRRGVIGDLRFRIGEAPL